MRIDLWQRVPGSRWTPRTDVPGLGTWISPSDPLLGSRPGDIFKYRQAVGRLVVPAAYRFRVTFRWSDAAGAVVRQTAVTTAACRQPDLRPDLVLDGVVAAPSPRAAGLVRYAVTVRNAGRSTAPRSLVAATLPGDAAPNQRSRSIRTTRPRRERHRRLHRPRLRRRRAARVVRRRSGKRRRRGREGNNELAAACPAP